MSHETGGPAFPAPDASNELFGQKSIFKGMTLRDYFAASVQDESDDYSDMVKEKFLGRACPSLKDDVVGVMEFEAEFRAKWRLMRADAMIKARELP